MTQEVIQKKFPVTTAEVAQMLGIDSTGPDLPLGTIVEHNNDLPVGNLPIAAPMVKKNVDSHDTNTTVAIHPVNSTKGNDSLETLGEKQAQSPIYIRAAKAVLPYIVVFATGLLLYYFFFTGVNFTSFFKSQPKAQTPKQTAVSQLQTQDLTAYYAWIKDYYYEINDPKLIDPEADNSGNGLTNYQKYLLNLNPKAFSTLDNGIGDGQAVSMGVNPLSGGALTDAQKAITAKYIDIEVLMNKLILNKLQHPEAVAGAGISASGQGYGQFSGSQTQNNPAISQNPQAVNPQAVNLRGLNLSMANNSNPSLNPSPAPNLNSGTPSSIVATRPAVAPVTGVNIDGVDPFSNTEVAGRLEIPSLNINVPLIWTKDPKNFDKDLQAGVVHYPGTALPGQIGTSYISGHSSNYSWAKGSYNKIFSTLGDLADNTSFKITVVQKNGKDAIYHYVVTHRQEYLPTDQEQFKDTNESVVALSTCWPVNSTAKRLVVFGVLTQVEK